MFINVSNQNWKETMACIFVRIEHKTQNSCQSKWVTLLIVLTDIEWTFLFYTWVNDKTKHFFVIVKYGMFCDCYVMLNESIY